MDIAIKNEDYKAKTLIENAKEAGQNSSLGEVRDYIINSSENDPNFFRWLFGSVAEYWNDFDCPKQGQQAWEDFVNEYF